jgi:hypothetical protein
MAAGASLVIAIVGSYFMVFAMGFFGHLLFMKLRLLGTGDLYIVDSETGAGTKHVVPINSAEVTVGGKPRKLTARAMVMLSGRRTWWQEAETGLNFVMPPKSKLLKDRVLQFLWIDNPDTYAHAVKTNDARDALLANSEKDPWVKALIIPILILGVLTLCIVGWLAYAFVKSGVGGPA